MEFLVLGPLQVYDAGRPVTIGAPRQRALLAVLLANSNRVVSTDRLLDLVWGDDPPEVGALRYQISKLRDALEPDRESGAGTDGSILIVDSATGQLVTRIQATDTSVGDVDFSSDGTHLAASTTDGLCYVYALDPDELVELARSRTLRSLTPSECAAYTIESCPALE